MSEVTIRDALTNAIAFWERGRLLYNLVLVAVVIAIYVAGLPRSGTLLVPDIGLNLFLLAVLANVAFCAAYVVDVAVQFSGFRAHWLRMRWLLLTLGIVFAATITQFIVRGMFGVGIHG